MVGRRLLAVLGTRKGGGDEEMEWRREVVRIAESSFLARSAVKAGGGRKGGRNDGEGGGAVCGRDRSSKNELVARRLQSSQVVVLMLLLDVIVPHLDGYLCRCGRLGDGLRLDNNRIPLRRLHYRRFVLAGDVIGR